jgi:hypothetical protein
LFAALISPLSIVVLAQDTGRDTGETIMRLSLRSIVGLSAAFGTMAFVLSVAILAPAEPSSASASTCPSKMKNDVQKVRSSGA